MHKIELQFGVQVEAKAFGEIESLTISGSLGLYYFDVS